MLQIMLRALRLHALALIFGLTSMFGVGFSFGAVGAELVYFGSPSCSVCERWEDEVGEIYPKTTEASLLPLRAVDVHDDRPDDLKFIRGIVYTPTFVAVEDGQEIGRIVGYMGDFFFWEQVDVLVKKLPPLKVSADHLPCSLTQPDGAPAKAC